MKRKDLYDATKELEVIRGLVIQGYTAVVYVTGDESVVEVSFTRQYGPNKWQVVGCSYMCCEWTSRALKRLARGAGIQPRHWRPCPNPDGRTQ
jgi:hypothetical protein